MAPRLGANLLHDAASACSFGVWAPHCSAVQVFVQAGPSHKGPVSPARKDGEKFDLSREGERWGCVVPASRVLTDERPRFSA
eukprot:tig00000254_g22539.t1